MTNEEKKSVGNIDVGDITSSTGVAIGHGASATVTVTQTGDVTRAFVELYRALEKQPDSPKKEAATQAVKELEKEANKGDKADEKRTKEWFNILMTMLPDIGEVAINTFINPISGLSTVFRKIAQKAQEGKKAE